jgi:hypothetical protein
MTPIEFDAGAGQVLAVYEPDDTGAEVDPGSIYAAVAADAADRAARGQRIVTMTTLGSRHAGVAFGRTGSGYQTKVTVTVVYVSTGAD